jgi:hypothetical protein
MDPPRSGLRSLFDELRRRRVVRVMLAYSAAVFALLQGAQPVFDGLLLPDFAFSLLVIIVLAGFPVVFMLAWVYELTAEGIRRTPRSHVPAKSMRVPVRRWLQVAGIFVMASGLAAGTAAGLGRLRFPDSADDGRIGLAVFPFRTTPAASEPWAEGVADLLATALDGTAGLRIVDPWSLWRPLRASHDSPAAAPGPETAATLAAETGAHRFLLGAAVSSGASVDLNLRLYQIGRAEPIAVFTINAQQDSLTRAVREVAVRVLARVWGGRRPADVPAELDFDATRSPDALKAYLAAKESMRRGWIDSANVAIDRALSLDSTFVLALVEAVTIKSWGFSTRGQPYAGFFELLDRADQAADSVNPRTRHRLEAMRASIGTDGRAAIVAARRILELDPTDLDAMTTAAYYERAYGWQFGVPFLEGGVRIEAAVRLDSTYVPNLASRAWWAVSTGDTADQRHQLERLQRADTSGTLGRAWLTALRVTLASDSQFNASLPALAALPAAQRFHVLGALRATRLARAEAMLRETGKGTDPASVTLADAELARYAVARGWTGRADSAITAGLLRANDQFRRLQFLIVAASLAGTAEDDVTTRTVTDLAAYLQPDSALAWFNSRPVWWGGWLIGAHHATNGDSSLAHRWIDAIGTLPRGGTPQDYVGALQADIASRIAARRGDTRQALQLATRAFELWSIHADNAIEAMPAPLIRFNRGLLLRASGQPDSARVMFVSLVPPTTWAGFLTARASFELGDIDLAAGDHTMAAFHFGRAIGIWEDAGPGATTWLEQTRNRLAGLANR